MLEVTETQILLPGSTFYNFKHKLLRIDIAQKNGFHLHNQFYAESDSVKNIPVKESINPPNGSWSERNSNGIHSKPKNERMFEKYERNLLRQVA